MGRTTLDRPTHTLNKGDRTLVGPDERKPRQQQQAQHHLQSTRAIETLRAHRAPPARKVDTRLAGLRVGCVTVSGCVSRVAGSRSSGDEATSDGELLNSKRLAPSSRAATLVWRRGSPCLTVLVAACVSATDAGASGVGRRGDVDAQAQPPLQVPLPAVDRADRRGYGSLIWNPPPHVASVEIAYARGGPDGWLRRFASACVHG